MRAVIFAVVAAASVASVASVASAQPTQPSDPAQPPETAPPQTPSPPPPDMPINAPATETAPVAAPPPAAPTAPAPATAAEPPPTAPAPATATEPAPPSDAAPVSEVAPSQPPAAPAITQSRNKDAAWLFVGGALTFITAGAVLGYSTSSAEQDIRDLYITTSGSPPGFDDATQQRYDELAAEGRRYEVLAWTSFGLAAGCAIGAAVFFVRASRESDDVIVTPVISPTSAGVSITF